MRDLATASSTEIPKASEPFATVSKSSKKVTRTFQSGEETETSEDANGSLRKERDPEAGKNHQD